MPAHARRSELPPRSGLTTFPEIAAIGLVPAAVGELVLEPTDLSGYRMLRRFAAQAP